LPAAIAAVAAVFIAVPVASAQGQAKQTLIAANGGSGNFSNLLVLNPKNGSVYKEVGPIGVAVTGIAEDPATGVLYGTTGGADRIAPGYALTISRRTGAGTLLGDTDGDPDDTDPVADITFTPDGVLFGWSEDSDDLVRINKVNGSATVVGESGLSTSGSGLASNSQGALVLAGEGDDDEIHRVNRFTGQVTPIRELRGIQGYAIAALAFSPDNTLWGARLQDGNLRVSDLILINTTTGLLPSLGPSVQALDALEWIDKPDRKVKLRAKFAGEDVRFRGRIKSKGNQGFCVRGERVLIRRKGGKGEKAKTVAKLDVSRKGRFKTTIDVHSLPQSFFAHARANPACRGDKSKTITVAG